jgi:taurine dioxygenase
MANTQALKPINIARRYKHIKPVPRMPNFAAWIEGVDLTHPLSAPVQAELRQALFDFEVIFFHPQRITPAQHVALAEVFGPVSSGSFFERKPGAPELEMIVCDRERPPSIDNWHTDISWKAQPPMGTAIQITHTPPIGGNTCWSSTSKAYDWLSPRLQKYFEGLTAVHSWEVSGFREALGQHGDEALFAAIKAFKPVVHPVVRLNPDSGRKCIYVNADFTRNIQGVDRHEARGMLHFLLDWMKKPEFTVHHQWSANEIAVWDNRSTQHYALADYWPHHRVNQRITFDGPGTAHAKAQEPAEPTAAPSVNHQVLKGKKLRG